jgi:hypothetical protein
MHRRRPSQEDKDDESSIGASTTTTTTTTLQPHTNGIPSRNRVNSTPSSPPVVLASSQSSYPYSPPSAGPLRTSFSGTARSPNGYPSSPLRSSFSVPVPSGTRGRGHTRTHSISGDFGLSGGGSSTDGGSLFPPRSFPVHPNGRISSFPSSSSGGRAHSRTQSFSNPLSRPSPPSPLAPSFPQKKPTRSTSGPSPTVSGFQIPDVPNGTTPRPPPSPNNNNRRHSRIHSRNLSVFFPQPGSLPHTSIAEDGAQEIDIDIGRADEEAAAPDVVIPHAHRRQRPGELGAGFTFGGKPGGGVSLGPAPAPSRGTARRGHHHKHSMSHNFFSFLEPGSQAVPSELHAQHTPMPESPWNPTSSLSSNDSPTTLPPPSTTMHSPSRPYEDSSGETTSSSSVGLPASVSQFMLGSWMWVTGQRVGSLACTGLGYWIVFDAFGVALNSVVPAYLARSAMQSKVRRPYGCILSFSLSLSASFVLSSSVVLTM